jgi:hypothetical protein
MRVTGSAGAPSPSPSSAVGRGVAASGFALPKVAERAEVAGARATLAPSGLLALQGVPDPAVERRRRAIRSAHALLDALDEARRGLLAGVIPVATLQRLRGGLREGAAIEADAGLRSVLNSIEVRSAVEAAKLEAATSTS